MDPEKDLSMSKDERCVYLCPHSSDMLPLQCQKAATLEHSPQGKTFSQRQSSHRGEG